MLNLSMWIKSFIFFLGKCNVYLLCYVSDLCLKCTRNYLLYKCLDEKNVFKIVYDYKCFLKKKKHIILIIFLFVLLNTCIISNS